MQKPKLTKKIDPLLPCSLWAWWQRVFFLPLLFLAWLYQIFFYIAQRIRRLSGGKTGYPFTIISVGNIAVGGTGKSVIIPFLAQLLGEDQCAVVLRGYRGSNERTGNSLLVSDGEHLLQPTAAAGDEAVMHSVQLRCPVVIGPSRAKSCDLLASCEIGKGVRYVLLDDAYQHHSVKKDIELVLLDARKPFDNGYCVPLGRLREKDLSRSTALILTHADALSRDQRYALKKRLQQKIGHDRIFFGSHQPNGFFLKNQESVDLSEIKKETLYAISGIGNSSNFSETLTSLGLDDTIFDAYPNHYMYSKKSVDEILIRAKSQKATGMVTTTKDWVKIAPHVLALPRSLPWYVLRVRFAFLDVIDNQRFFQIIQSEEPDRRGHCRF